MDLSLTNAFWLGCSKLGKTFSRRFAKTLEIIFAWTMISDIGGQFLITPLSFPFFSINVIIACFCELKVLQTHKSNWCSLLEVSQSKTKKPNRILLLVHRSQAFYFLERIVKKLKHSLYSIFPSHTIRNSR